MNGDLHLRIKIGDDEFEAEGTERTVAKAVDVFLDAIGKLPPAGVEDAMTELGGATFHEMSKIMSAQPDENDEVYPEFAENVSSAEAAAPKRRGHGNGSPGRPPSADSRAEKVTETAVSHDVKTYQYHADFLRVVDWIRMEGIEVTKRDGGKWQPGDRDPMTPRELIEFANRRRENASQMPFRVPHIMA